MRDYRLQTAINLLRLAKSGEVGFRQLLSYTQLWLIPSGKKKIAANKFYDRRDLTVLKKYSLAMAKFDPLWFPRLFEPTTGGVRAWEYGVLLSNVTFRNKKVLDLGVGSSRLPDYLAHKGARVTAVDLMSPMEEEIVNNKKSVKWLTGDMTNLTIADNSFDIILNISAMEHLDAEYPSNLPVERKLFLARTRKTIREMVRICKKKGLIFVTTDFYLLRQKTDDWQTKVKYKGIGGAYKSDELFIFLDEFRKAGARMVGKSSLDFGGLVNYSQFASFRGRYFTTAAFLFTKL